MDGEILSRPLSFPRRYMTGLFIIVAIAALIAGICLFSYFDSIANEPAREQSRIDANLAMDIPLDLPNMLSLVGLDDAAIDAELRKNNDTFIERSAPGSAEGYEIIKLANDVSIVDAAEMYAKGIKNLSPAQAVTLLNGSWDLSIERKAGINLSLHYADFKSGTVENAIASAIKAEGLDAEPPTDSGENDGYGNAFSTGTVKVGEAPFSWTVSAIPLKEVYSIAGLPENAVYVGIRVKTA